jgi:GTPase SAR1 family protein
LEGKCKCVVIGDKGVGKSTLIENYLYTDEDFHYRTLHACIDLTDTYVKVDSVYLVMMSLEDWDCEYLGEMDVGVFLLVFSIVDRCSFENIELKVWLRFSLIREPIAHLFSLCVISIFHG